MAIHPPNSGIEPLRRLSPLKSSLRKLGPALPAIAVLAAMLAVGLFAIVADRPCPVYAGFVAGNGGVAGPAIAG